MNKTIPFLRLNGWSLALVWLVGSSLAEDNWSQFRGPNGQGVVQDARPPVEFGPEKNRLWQTAVGEGHSSPCIYGNRLFLTSYDESHVVCEAYDRRTGDKLWQQRMAVPELEPTHKFSNPAAPTPAANAERVVVYFGSFGLIGFDHDGVEQWRLPLPRPESRGSYGSASSPILVDGLVIQTLDSKEGKSRIIAVDSLTGEIRWETPRPLFSASWSTPVLFQNEGRPDLLVLGSKKLVAYDPKSGVERWSVGGFPGEVVAVPAVGNGLVFAAGAGIGGRSDIQFEAMQWEHVAPLDKNADGALTEEEIPEDYRVIQRPELPEGHPGRRLPWPLRSMLGGFDDDKDGRVTEKEWTSSLAAFETRDTPILAAIRVDGSAVSDPECVAWRHTRGIPEIPSPLLYDGKVFLVRDGGLVQCLEAASGSLLYNERVGVAGGYCASPVGADGRIYLSAHSGTIVVVDGRSDTLVVLAKNDLGESITATPAIVDDCLYVRTAKHLYGFAQGSTEGGDNLLSLAKPMP